MKHNFKLLIYFSLSIILAGCNIENKNNISSSDNNFSRNTELSSSIISSNNDSSFHSTPILNNEIYQNFSLNNIIDSDYGIIHYNIYIPKTYTGQKRYALYLTLPGYEGLYRFGVGANLKAENFAFEAQKYNDEMIIVAPQLNDWGETSARQTIILTEYIMSNYFIDESKVFINGYSGGGETLSLVLTYRPELYKAALHVASIWDGRLEPLINSKTPIYFVIGENDEYYGSSRISSTYNNLIHLYQDKGLTNEEIKELAVLDIKKQEYFDYSNQHGGIGKVASDSQIMSWLFLR